jgi:hypothetical protein
LSLTLFEQAEFTHYCHGNLIRLLEAMEWQVGCLELYLIRSTVFPKVYFFTWGIFLMNIQGLERSQKYFFLLAVLRFFVLSL